MNLRAQIALVLAVAPNVPGFLINLGMLPAQDFWTGIYHYAWFIGFLIAFVFYYVLMAGYRPKENT